ncbi:MAG TPA: dTDP-4-dehydrorhamnose reductase, partial [Pseudonocardiaceae bacterium]|nr:dTDP-4-dehydrorhamnose reductase [Pseudonocardiaceae bacterium]
MSAPLALLVTGGKGQLGSEVAAAGDAAGAGLVRAPGSAELDVTDGQQVRDAVASLVRDAGGLRPVVVNAAAYTAVDDAETDSERAYQVNAIGPGLLASACAELSVPLLHVSTDYVFDGLGSRPYEPPDPTGPRSAYGRTKLAGERAVLSSAARAHVVRTAWLYGAVGNNFVKSMARLQRSRPTLSVVDDQRGSPTWSADLAAGLVELAAAADRLRPGVLHCVNGGETTWFGFARAVFEELGADPSRVTPCSSEQFPRPAPRPAYSVLSVAAWRSAGLTPLRDWRSALAAAFTRHRMALA